MPKFSRRSFIGYLAGLSISGLLFRGQANAAQDLSIHNGWVLRSDDFKRLNLR